MRALAILVIVAALSLFVAFDGPLPCGATFAKESDHVTAGASGFMIRTEGPAGDPMQVGVAMRGNGDYEFRYSKSIIRIRLISRGIEIYSGAPVEKYTVPRGPFNVEVHTIKKCESFSIAIRGSCSISSYWQGLS